MATSTPNEYSKARFPQYATRRVDVNAAKLMRNVTLDVHVTGIGRMPWRLRAGLQVIRLGALLAGVRCEVKREP
jgi:hypothetical protein